MIHVKETYRHFRIVQECHLEESSIVGGGSCFMNAENQLFVGDYSGDYGAISTEAALRFGELLVPKVEKLKIPVNDVLAAPEEKRLHPYWR